LFAVIAAIAAFAYKASWPRGRTLGATVLAGLGLFAVPSVLIEVAKGAIDDATRVALFSLAPLFAVVFDPHLGSGSTPQQRGGLAASLIAVCGSLLVFPLDLPRSTAAAFACGGIVAAVASVAAANCLSVRLACEQPTRSALSFAAIAAGSAAIALGAWSAVFERHTWSASRFDPWTTLDLLALVLLFWLMRRMAAVRMTTRFLIAPPLANLIGLAFLRPGVQPRGWLGLLLIAAGSGWLLLGPEEEPEETGSSLGINQS
jgi:drug/metabolite transporter (DMT)-like permease